MLTFKQGFITPPLIYPLDLATFKREFATNDRRKIILAAYDEYLDELCNLFHNIPFTQWINGSFVTKKADPSDLDIVTWLSEENFAIFKDQIQPFVRPNCKSKFGGYIDAFIAPQTEWDNAIWQYEFHRIKPYRKNSSLGFSSKGFIQINFNQQP